MPDPTVIDLAPPSTLSLPVTNSPSSSYPPSAAPSLRNVGSEKILRESESKEPIYEEKDAAGFASSTGSLDQNGIVPEDGLPQPDGNAEQDDGLPPKDGGLHAWLFLAASFVVEALVWGFPFSFGVFQEYYSTHPPFAGSGNIAVIGTCAMGIMYLDLIIVFALLVLYPQYQRFATIGGLLTMCLALGLSSLSKTTTHLIATQGIVYAIGGSFAYSPCILFMDQWFQKRIGLAYGIMWAGTGLAGVILPIVMEWMLHRYGYQTTLRTWAICLFILTGPLLWFIKPRIPVEPRPKRTKRRASPPPSTSALDSTGAEVHHTEMQDQTSKRNPNWKRLNMSFLLHAPFPLHQFCNVIEALGFFLPSIYMPTYARSLGASSSLAALTVILFNVSSVVGCVLMGSIVDKWHVTTCILISTAGTVVSVFVVWGLSISLPTLYVFSLLYGLFAGSFTSAWPGIMRDVKKKHGSADPSIVFACLAAGRGIGNVASGPLSEALIKGLPWRGEAGWAYGSGYGTLIVFTGITAALGGGSVLGKRIGWL